MSVLINMTYNGRSGNYLANIDEGLDDASIRRICEEAVRAGEVAGMPKEFVVRPKVPFGA
jgi:hypothetical protein